MLKAQLSAPGFGTWLLEGPSMPQLASAAKTLVCNQCRQDDLRPSELFVNADGSMTCDRSKRFKGAIPFVIAQLTLM